MSCLWKTSSRDLDLDLPQVHPPNAQVTPRSTLSVSNTTQEEEEEEKQEQEQKDGILITRSMTDDVVEFEVLETHSCDPILDADALEVQDVPDMERAVGSTSVTTIASESSPSPRASIKVHSAAAVHPL